MGGGFSRKCGRVLDSAVRLRGIQRNSDSDRFAGQTTVSVLSLKSPERCLEIFIITLGRFTVLWALSLGLFLWEPGVKLLRGNYSCRRWDFAAFSLLLLRFLMRKQGDSILQRSLWLLNFVVSCCIF